MDAHTSGQVSQTSGSDQKVHNQSCKVRKSDHEEGRHLSGRIQQ